MSAMKPAGAPETDADTETVGTPSAAISPAAAAPDKFHGQGGSYVRDPATGERVLVERTSPCDCGGAS
ncbi:hypothetical protein ACWV16_22360 [Achromobacter xylosoxidans]|uniref:hypothetical protein n=1 Tax=Alcaligenes xylosoxydans xylosoxydans TaxID=85698 RepID=UPI0003321440|nr:hypothetical protein [Achromobacter xylosoxidans]MCH1990573.1 hypothetical protein [Achromobacter xylosoxidans]MCH1993364.1 hypothetical protein [Achromobacter xylosoxidans]MCH4588458.1 hypothetical protein [Achromobacter xylosoxidans]OAS93021.1 hypothetical protein A6I77_24710 [Achromobacter xylosoxidans]QKI79097.1 hypothetical protein HPS43_28880 [Achromobacter xylosoxidans]